MLVRRTSARRCIAAPRAVAQASSLRRSLEEITIVAEEIHCGIKRRFVSQFFSV